VEGHPREDDRTPDLPGVQAALALARERRERADAERLLGQLVGVPDAAVDDTARFPPTRPQRLDPPPSTTSTRPSPGLSTACLISVLSSNSFTVVIGPLNRTVPPKIWNTGSQTWISGWASQRSVVAGLVTRGSLSSSGLRYSL
jgi:hypothetical protein